MQLKAINSEIRMFQLAMRHFKILSVLFPIVFVLGISSAQANQLRWKDLAADYMEDGVFRSPSPSCSTCHAGTGTQSYNDNLTMEAPSTVAFDGSTIEVELKGFETNPTRGNAYWQYQVVGGVGRTDDSASDNTSKQIDIPIPSDDEIRVRYCLLDGENAGQSSAVSWNCDTETVRRNARVNQFPTITYNGPSNLERETNSTPFDITVEADDDITVVTLSVVSSNASAVTVNPPTTVNPLTQNTYTLSFVGAGQSTIRMTAQDSDGAEVERSFSVTVTSPVIVPPDVVPPVVIPPVVVPPVVIPPVVVPPVVVPPVIIPSPQPVDLPPLPVAIADTVVYFDQEASQIIDVLLNDSGGALSVVLDSNTSSQGNEVDVNGNLVFYRSQGVLTSNDSFTYRVQNESNALSDPAVVTVIPSDVDGDGVVDVLDNCPLLPNSDQGNMDSDQLGDLCDVDPDNDGTPGINGIAFESGRDLVIAECLECHQNGALGAPLFGDANTWDAIILAAGGQPVDLLDSVLFGKGSMPYYADTYATQELLQAILYLTGREDSAVAPPDDGIDKDPMADTDGDGIPFSLDDDDSNSGRLHATYPNTNGTVFTSANTLRLGRIAAAAAVSNVPPRFDVVLSESSFARGVGVEFPGITVMADSQHSSLIGVINLGIEALSGGAEVIVELKSNLPLNSAIRLFDTGSGQWNDFTSDTFNSFASAPLTTRGGCPLSASANYRAVLTAGLSCVRLNVQDGGANDADGIVNNQVELIFDIARKVLEDGGPATVNLNPAKSGGGSTGPWILIVLLLTRLLLCSSQILRLRR
jgi:cytochrome c5